MKNTIKKRITEKGQGLTEYVLILAFIAGVAMAMFGNGGLKTTVVNTLTDTVEILANLFTEPEPNSYRAAYAKYSKTKWSDLYHNESTADERFQADLDALKLIGNTYLDMTRGDLENLLEGRSIPDKDLLYNEDSPTSNGITIINYKDKTINDNEYKASLLGGQVEESNFSPWEKSQKAVLAMTGKTEFDSNSYYNNGTWMLSTEKLFYSDGMLAPTDNDKQVKANFTFEGTGKDAKVTSVHLYVSQHNGIDNNYDMQNHPMSVVVSKK